MRIGAIVGNPKPYSRTYSLANEVVGALHRKLGGAPGQGSPWIADLGQRLDAMGRWPAGVEDYLDWLRGADVVVVASPVYKASYTGLLKHFLDLMGRGELEGKVALPVMTGASPHHSLALDVHLIPLLYELGCYCPTRGIYVVESELPRAQEIVAAWMERNGPILEAVREP